LPVFGLTLQSCRLQVGETNREGLQNAIWTKRATVYETVPEDEPNIDPSPTAAARLADEQFIIHNNFEIPLSH
jgi:hypothetical protein